MNRDRITAETVKLMRKLKRDGATHIQIMEICNVSKKQCSIYLKDIPTSIEATNAWLEAENDAVQILKVWGFYNIVNLNQLSNNPYWDYYACKGKKKWLIDVTINGKKLVSKKYDRCIDGYNHGILRKGVDQWKLIPVIIDPVLTHSINTKT